MGAATGIALRGMQFFLRIVQFCCAAIVLALFSYFLATLNNHNLAIGTWVRAVEGISGAAVLYTILALLALCCLAGRSFPSFITMLFDVAFIGGFIYIAWANRNGASSCNGIVDTPYGTGDADTNVGDNGHGGFTQLPSLRQACRMQTACLAVSIVAIIFFALTPIVSLALVRHRRKENRYGPSPANDYTQGYGRPKKFGWFGLGRKRGDAGAAGPNPDALPQHTTPGDVRTSYATEATRVGSSGGYGGLGGQGPNKYEAAQGGGWEDVPMGNYPTENRGYQPDTTGGGYR